MADNDTLDPTQERAIIALLTERNTRAAAKAANVPERTLWRWLGDPAFRQELTRREGELIEQATRRLVVMQDMAIDAFCDVFAQANEDIDADLGKFFKISKRWTEEPLPTDEILAEKEIIKKVRGVPEKRKLYRVKKVAFDVKALMDPKRSHLVRKFSDSPNAGVSIDLHDAQGAAALKLRAAQSVLDFTLKLRELNSLEERIRKLEEAENEQSA